MLQIMPLFQTIRFLIKPAAALIPSWCFFYFLSNDLLLDTYVLVQQSADQDAPLCVVEPWLAARINK